MIFWLYTTLNWLIDILALKTLKYKGENYWCLYLVCIKCLICNCCWVCLCCLSKFWLAVAVAALTHLAVRSYIFIRWEVPPTDFYTLIDYAVINPNDTVGVHQDQIINILRVKANFNQRNNNFSCLFTFHILPIVFERVLNILAKINWVVIYKPRFLILTIFQISQTKGWIKKLIAQ